MLCSVFKDYLNPGPAMGKKPKAAEWEDHDSWGMAPVTNQSNHYCE